MTDHTDTNSPNSFEVITNFNAIVFIDGMPEKDAGTTRRIREDIAAIAVKHGFLFFEHRVLTAHQLEGTLATLNAQIRQGLKPVLCIDMHGGPDGSLYPGNDESEAIDVNRLHQLLAGTNVLTGGQLTVVSAACWGLRTIMPTQLADPSPCYMLVAANEKISFASAEAGLAPFFNDILINGNLISAQKTHLPDFSTFLAERMLFRTLVMYIWHNCRGRSKAERVEKLVTLLREEGWPDGVSLGEARRHFKDGISPAGAQALIDRYTKSFLLGRKPSFTLEDVLLGVDAYVPAEKHAG